MPQAAEVDHREKEGLAAAVVGAKHSAGSASALAAASVTGEIGPQAAGRAARRPSLEGADRRTEPASVPQATEADYRGKEAPSTDGAFLDVHQASSSRDDHSKQMGESTKGAWTASAPQKPISAVAGGDPAVGQGDSEPMTPGGSSDKVLPIREAMTETPGPAHDHAQSRNSMPNHQMRLPEREMFPFRMEMPHVVSSHETRSPATVGSKGVKMQAVIDHILEARQGVGNDFGRVRILLNPPDLGAVDLDIVVRRERVDVVMIAENATVQQALQSRSDDVRMALHRHDLKMEGFQVFLQDNGTGRQQTGSGEMYRQNREHRERFNARVGGAPALQLFSSVTGENSAAGRISIFA